MPAVNAAEHQVPLKGKRFLVKELVINVGDKVSFPNWDPFVHNIFSLSHPRLFDLGTNPESDARTVVFDKPGFVDVECAIHPGMHMVIEVMEAGGK